MKGLVRLLQDLKTVQDGEKKVSQPKFFSVSSVHEGQLFSNCHSFVPDVLPPLKQVYSKPTAFSRSADGENDAVHFCKVDEEEEAGVKVSAYGELAISYNASGKWRTLSCACTGCFEGGECVSPNTFTTFQTWECVTKPNKNWLDLWLHAQYFEEAVDRLTNKFAEKLLRAMSSRFGRQYGGKSVNAQKAALATAFSDWISTARKIGFSLSAPEEEENDLVVVADVPVVSKKVKTNEGEENERIKTMWLCTCPRCGVPGNWFFTKQTVLRHRVNHQQ